MPVFCPFLPSFARFCPNLPGFVQFRSYPVCLVSAQHDYWLHYSVQGKLILPLTLLDICRKLEKCGLFTGDTSGTTQWGACVTLTLGFSPSSIVLQCFYLVCLTYFNFKIHINLSSCPHSILFFKANNPPYVSWKACCPYPRLSTTVSLMTRDKGQLLNSQSHRGTQGDTGAALCGCQTGWPTRLLERLALILANMTPATPS